MYENDKKVEVSMDQSIRASGVNQITQIKSGELNCQANYALDAQGDDDVDEYEYENDNFDVVIDDKR